VANWSARAGAVARLSAKEGEWSVIILPSGEMRRVKSKCRATIGQLGYLDWINVSIGKAGRARHMGIRPHTRAKAMNPESITRWVAARVAATAGVIRSARPACRPRAASPARRGQRVSKLILRRRKFGTHQVRPQTVNVKRQQD
jgi:large subunit ribosomal protein L2